MTVEQKKITAQELSEVWGTELSQYVQKKIEEYDLTYEDVTLEERDQCLKTIVKTLLDQFLVYSGEHRLEQWNKGWGENFENLEQSGEKESILPKYFGKYNIVRFKQKFIKPISKNFEVNSLYIIQDWLFDAYAREAENIYEFGCGTGHNLMRLREINKEANLYGLDWATSSQNIINKVREDGFDEKIFGHNFDFFKPDTNFSIGKNSVVYTIAALEQIGEKHGEFINYLRQQKPDICIHVEPIGELLDTNNLLDYLSVEYFKKRNYLHNYYTRLKELENAGEIEIVESRRSYIGSLFIDGYSVIVWKFKK